MRLILVKLRSNAIVRHFERVSYIFAVGHAEWCFHGRVVWVVDLAGNSFIFAKRGVFNVVSKSISHIFNPGILLSFSFFWYLCLHNCCVHFVFYFWHSFSFFFKSCWILHLVLNSISEIFYPVILLCFDERRSLGFHLRLRLDMLSLHCHSLHHLVGVRSGNQFCRCCISGYRFSDVSHIVFLSNYFVFYNYSEQFFSGPFILKAIYSGHYIMRSYWNI